jgi:hypothetical protein
LKESNSVEKKGIVWVDGLESKWVVSSVASMVERKV